MIFFCSCGNKRTDDSNNSDSVLKIDLLSEPGSKLKNLSELATNIEYIPLQTNESSLLGNITRKIIRRDNRIYIHSKDEILCFDMDGKFLFKLENTGRGPQEYVYLLDFDVSSDNKILAVLSSYKLLKFGITQSGFTFQKSITIKDPRPYRIGIVPETDNTFLAIAPFTGAEATLSLLINTSSDTVHYKPNSYKYKMIRQSNYQALNEMLVYSNGNMVCFKEEFSDTVFYVDAKDITFKPRLIFDSHGTLYTSEMRGGSETVGNNTTFIANIFETSRYVYYLFFTRGEPNGVLFDKTKKTKYSLDIDNHLKSELKDDLSGGPDFNIEFRDNYCSGGKLFSFVEAITLKKYVAGEDFRNAHASNPVNKIALKKLADSLNETDNPILIVVTPKE